MWPGISVSVLWKRQSLVKSLWITANSLCSLFHIWFYLAAPFLGFTETTLQQSQIVSLYFTVLKLKLINGLGLYRDKLPFWSDKTFVFYCRSLELDERTRLSFNLICMRWMNASFLQFNLGKWVWLELKRGDGIKVSISTRSVSKYKYSTTLEPVQKYEYHTTPELARKYEYHWLSSSRTRSITLTFPIYNDFNAHQKLSQFFQFLICWCVGVCCCSFHCELYRFP